MSTLSARLDCVHRLDRRRSRCSAPVCFFVDVLLAGPHSSMLPSAVQPVVLVLGWLVLLVAPILVARRIWRRTGRPT
jgi:hypothetical protein